MTVLRRELLSTWSIFAGCVLAMLVGVVGVSIGLSTTQATVAGVSAGLPVLALYTLQLVPSMNRSTTSNVTEANTAREDVPCH